MDGQETKNRAILFTFGVSYTLNDVDGDGVIGSRDRCPDEAEYWNGSADDDGCADDDRDGDRVVGKADQCPAEPEDRNKYEDSDGCPDARKDKDGDGIADRDDICVDQAFPYNKELEGGRRGCPPDFDLDLVRVGRGELELTPPLEFDFGQDQLTSDHQRVLEQVIVLMRDYYPRMKLIVEGHADSKVGEKAKDNTGESKVRATAVETYLVDNGGIARERLRIEFRGTDNARGVEIGGRQRSNRRVDLIILANPKP